MKKLILLLLVSTAIGSGVVCAQPEIRVVGLFSGRAVLMIDGQQRLLKVGDTSPEGVRLVASNSSEATLEVAGKRFTAGLSEHIASGFSQAQATEVRINRAMNGHYFIGGNINGRATQFMVDTGASMIAMNINDAKRLGVDLRRANNGAASTAGGVVNTFVVTLPKVTVGTITLYNIPASVVQGDFPENILLGNSFLSRVEMQEQNGVLVLRQKH